MAGENDGGTQAAAQQQTSGQADAQQQQQAGQAQQTGAGVGKHTKTDSDGNPVVNDNGGASEGKHAADGAYQAAIKQRDAKIAELEAQIAKAAETKETADKLTAEIADLKQQSADERVAYELRLAGARNVTAAKALLSEHDGDVNALKEAEPWLFEAAGAKNAKQQSGTTGLEPAGASGKDDSMLKRWERIAVCDGVGCFVTYCFCDMLEAHLLLCPHERRTSLSRTPRKQSESNVYHIFARGVGRVQLFEDDADNSYFLDLLERMASHESCAIFAYCLMGNHFHLVVRMPINDLSEAMRRLEVSYAQYFNEKHGRTGTLFQGRFGSEPIDSDEQLLAAIRYVHLNPEKASMAPFDAYEWSSYQSYRGTGGIVDTSLLFGMIGNGARFEEFHRSGSGDTFFMEESSEAGNPIRRRLSDREVKEVAKSELGIESVLDLGGLPRKQRNEVLACLKDRGATVRQLERLTGIGRGIIARA